MNEQLQARRVKSILAWGKRAGIPGSTIHAFHTSGKTSHQNIEKLARVVGENPKDVFIRLGMFNEELSEDDPSVKRLADALALVPAELRPLAADLAAATIERLQGRLGQSVAEIYLRAEDRQEGQE